MLANSALLPLSTNKITRTQRHYDVTTVMSLSSANHATYRDVHCTEMNLIGAHNEKGHYSFLFVYPLDHMLPQFK